MVGCWVRTTPVHKRKGQLGNDQPTPQVQSLRHAIREKQTSKVGYASTSQVLKKTGRPSFRLSWRRLPDSDMGEPDDTGEAHSASSPRHGPPSKRPRINFSTLLADAQTNRVVLHAKKGSSKIPEKFVIPLAASHPSPVTHRTEPSPHTHQAESILSDDSLDLFAPSSPRSE